MRDPLRRAGSRYEREDQLDFIIPDESATRSFGLVPIEFDKPDECLADIGDIIHERGVL